MDKRIAILTANLGSFDKKDVDPPFQVLPAGFTYAFHRFNDGNFPPITGLSPRFQYRIPKLFGWEMFPGYDYYFWLDGSMSLTDGNSLEWFLKRIVANNDMVLFKHPWRNTIQEEAQHIEEKLAEGNKYLLSRYLNGLHKEQVKECLSDPNFKDDKLYASTVFMYKNGRKMREAMKAWWYYQSRYYTVDQLALPYIVKKHYLKIHEIGDNIFKIPQLTISSPHK